MPMYALGAHVPSGHQGQSLNTRELGACKDVFTGQTLWRSPDAHSLLFTFILSLIRFSLKLLTTITIPHCSRYWREISLCFSAMAQRIGSSRRYGAFSSILKRNKYWLLEVKIWSVRRLTKHMDVSTLDPGLLNMTLQLVYTSIIWNIFRTVDPPSPPWSCLVNSRKLRTARLKLFYMCLRYDLVRILITSSYIIGCPEHHRQP